MNFFKGQLYSGVAYVSIHSHFDRSTSFLRISSCLPSKKVSTFLEAMLGFMCVSSLLLRITEGLLGMTSDWSLSMTVQHHRLLQKSAKTRKCGKDDETQLIQGN